MSLSDIFFYFLFMYSFGTIAFLPLVDSKLTGSAHSKLTAAACTIASFLASLGLGLVNFKLSWLVCLTALHGLILFIIYLIHRDERSLWVKVLHVTSLFLGLIFIFILTSSWSDRLILLTSTFLLGVINYTMILGHYYLVVPKLTVRPLLIGIRIYWFTLFVKLVLLFPLSPVIKLWGQLLQALGGMDTAGTSVYDVSVLSLFFFHQISEYVALPLISIFAYKLCLMRSTQSATGLFYVMVFFALISEMLSVYFLLIKGMGI